MTKDAKKDAGGKPGKESTKDDKKVAASKTKTEDVAEKTEDTNSENTCCVWLVYNA